MKRLACFLLATFILLSTISCDNIDNSVNGNTQTTETLTPTQKIDAEPYDGIFRAGYARQDVTPDSSIYLNPNGNADTYMSTNVLDPIYATCIALFDGENTLLIYTIDVSNVNAEQCKIIRARVSKATGVCEDNVIVSATHNHSAPQPGLPTNQPVNIRWTNQFFNELVVAAENAIADLSDAEIYMGSTRAEGMSFTNRFILSDGTPSSIWTLNYEYKKRTDIVAYESEADDFVGLIRFVRENKKDILLANWGVHFTSAGDLYPNTITADLNYYLRYVTENEDDDLLFAFYLGACGNTSAKEYVKGTKNYPNYAKMGMALGEKIVAAAQNLTRAEAGKINVTILDYEAQVRKDDAKRVADANEVLEKTKNIKTDSNEYYAILEEYGFESKFDVQNVISRNAESRGNFDIIRITAVSFGDIGFVGVPYEMFDTNGIEIRNASPFKMTLVVTACGGSSGYVPSALAVPNGGYQVYRSPFVFGTAEKVVSLLVDTLFNHKDIS